MTLSCPNCSYELPDTAKFCSECGTSVNISQLQKEVLSCRKCGKQLTEGAKFCLECGASVVPSPEIEALFEEIMDSAPGARKYVDFDETEARSRVYDWVKHEMMDMTVRDWALILSQPVLFKRMYPDSAWRIEKNYYQTNKPNTHKAFFYKTMIQQFEAYVCTQGYVNGYDQTFSPEILAEIQKLYPHWPEEDIQEMRFEEPDLSDIEQWAKEDDRLFPPANPVQAEVDGNIVLNFTSDEAAIVVYVDALHKGKQITLKSSHPDFPRIGKDAVVQERKYNKASYYVAIFNHLPIITNRVRHSCIPIESAVCIVTFYNLEEEITVYKGHASTIDWQGWEVQNDW